MLTKKFLDGTITFTELISEEFKNEIRTLQAKMENGKEQVVQAVKKVMKFVSKLSTGKQTINLVEFYKTGNKKQPLWLGDNFQQILKEATSDSETVEIDETFYQHQNTETVTDNDAMAELKETQIDLGTAEGRLEARKRLGAMAHFLKQQPKAEKGELLTNGYANVIGWFKTKSGSVFNGYCDWFADYQEWYCFSFDLSDWSADQRFWSRNGEAQ